MSDSITSVTDVSPDQRLIDAARATRESESNHAHQRSTSGEQAIERITSAYRDYYDLQTSNGNGQASIAAVHRLVSAFQNEFPGELAAYWELNDRLFSLWQEHVGRSDPEHYRVFMTNGSTRHTSRQYKVGPYADVWIQATWELTRHPLGWRTVVKLDVDMNERAPFAIRSERKDIYQHVITCGPLSQEVLTQLLEVLRQLLCEYPAISLISVPDTFLYLNRQPAFQEFAIEYRDVFNLMSQHWEPFYPRADLQNAGVHINDALCDWTTGVFFYTCREGHLHTLPTCAVSGKERVNLLNLMPTPEFGPGTEEDLFEPISISECSCGKNRLNFRFVPHQATVMRLRNGDILYDPQLADRLTSSFRSLQFIQEGETVTIRYRSDGEMHDRELLEDYFRTQGFQVQWQPNDFYLVGTKRPVFFWYPG